MIIKDKICLGELNDLNFIIERKITFFQILGGIKFRKNATEMLILMRIIVSEVFYLLIRDFERLVCGICCSDSFVIQISK